MTYMCVFMVFVYIGTRTRKTAQLLLSNVGWRLVDTCWQHVRFALRAQVFVFVRASMLVCVCVSLRVCVCNCVCVCAVCVLCVHMFCVCVGVRTHECVCVQYVWIYI